MTQTDFLTQLLAKPNTVDFEHCIAYIDSHYRFMAARFTNGPLINEKGQNEGSCKIFAFGLLNALSEDQTLACFGRFYREEVLQNPAGDNHQNIRQFMQTGWKGIHFDEIPLANR